VAQKSGIQLELKWPFVVTRSPGAVSAEEFEEYLTAMERAVLPADRNYVNIVITSKDGYGHDRRDRHVAWQKQHKAVLVKHCRGTALVMPEISIFMRFALSALLSLMGDSATPTKLFTNESDARDWAVTLLRKRESAA